ncbi:MAG: hypothetical protein QM652_10540 [Legionella sp.]|uniref:hypothetical protein n=1 Tax=Legionella sp. TaxID=459 RepID=UPI0039E30B08
MRFLLDYLRFIRIAMTVSCFVAVGVLLWPGALAAATNFSLFGYSIASVFGTGLVQQTAGVAISTFAGLHLLGISIDLAGLCYDLLKYCCCVPKQIKEPTQPLKAHEYQLKSKGDSNTMMNTMMPPGVPTRAKPNIEQPTVPSSNLYPDLNSDPTPNFDPGYPQLYS